ncbi:unnamed protein product [Lasius platythorax]|uniref:RNA-directed DNA polymerase n=1 Tax=Lasius platythorax TaxID=488582 RepID=A0AAV2MYS6_9HYME
MDRQRLEKMTKEELDAEAIKYGLDPSDTRKQCIEAIVLHLEEHGPKDLLDNRDSQSRLSRGASTSYNSPIGEEANVSHSMNSTRVAAAESMLPQFCSFLAEQIMQQQETMRRMMEVLSISHTSQPLAQTVPASSMGMSQPTVSPTAASVPSRSNNPPQFTSAPSGGASENAQVTSGQRRTAFTNIFPAQAVKLLASQIPEFDGAEDESVELWLQKIERIAQIHGVSEEVTFLAAAGKLTKSARRWYDMSTGSTIESWMGFKTAITKRFKRRVLFHIVMQKIEARKWIYTKETFHEYAMDKLALMKNLRLPDQESIHLLINGIASKALRGTAAALRVETVDEFLEEMFPITIAFGESYKKPPYSTTKPEKNKLPENIPDKTQQVKISKEAYCVYCRAKGHVREDCAKLKKKEQQPKSNTSPKPATVSAVSDDNSTVAVIGASEKKAIETGKIILAVQELNGVACQLSALLDTGSPISLVSQTVYNKYLKEIPNVPVSQIKTFNAINGTNIDLIGLIDTKILESLPNIMSNINLHILKNNSFTTDLIIGRDFLIENEIQLIYILAKEIIKDKLYLLREIASVETVDIPSNNLEELLSQIETDFDVAVKNQLISVICEVENSKIDCVNDDCLVKIALKDESPYAYAPRRFAWSERLQLRAITDDLLTRYIIKPSSSPYCAQVVPVRKRNGSLRLCVDLRPLNDRVIKQRYPFPIIEDCLTRLSGKKIFTLIDLKDGFHNIKIHPDFTKFFAFATPDGQFEFKRLPFGFCDSPAEFQRRLIHILQPLIKKYEVIIYIDDILIPSVTVEDNVDVLRKVLILLKQYKFEPTFQKCSFLKTTIEYLGKVISPSGISLSPRHTDAVRNFPLPKKIVEVQRFLGLTNFFRRFIQNYATIAKPLNNLLKKSVEFDFNSECLDAFLLLKKKLIDHPVLRLYNPTFSTELHTDASAIALAAILLQKQEDGQWAPVAYYSQATNRSESNYHSFELEMLAVVKAIERFHIYLFGLEFSVITDCHALVYAVNKAHLNSRIARWTIRLQNYRFKVIHREGKRMSHVDALNRIVAYMDSMPLERELEYKQLQDTRLKSIAEQLEYEDNEKFVLLEGLIFRKGQISHDLQSQTQ